MEKNAYQLETKNFFFEEISYNVRDKLFREVDHTEITFSTAEIPDKDIINNNEEHISQRNFLAITSSPFTLLSGNKISESDTTVSRRAMWVRVDKAYVGNFISTFIQKINQSSKSNFSSDLKLIANNVVEMHDNAHISSKLKDFRSISQMEEGAVKTRLAELKMEEIILLCLQQGYSRKLQNSSAYGQNPMDRLIDTIKSTLKDKWSSEAMANEINMSVPSVHRLFKQTLGTTPNKFVTELRITQAKELIKTRPELNISEVAYEIGLENPPYFTRLFKSITGHTPSEYRLDKNI